MTTVDDFLSRVSRFGTPEEALELEALIRNLYLVSPTVREYMDHVAEGISPIPNGVNILLSFGGNKSVTSVIRALDGAGPIVSVSVQISKSEVSNSYFINNRGFVTQFDLELTLA